MSARKPTPPWLFGLTCIPYGVVGSFSTIVMPFAARRGDVDVGTIGWFVTLLFVPPMLQFLYTPVVDFGPKRKHWVVLLSVLSAVCILGACLMPIPDQLLPFLILTFLAQTITGLLGASNGGLMTATIPDDKRGKAGAWYNVGNLCGGGISASIALYMTGHEVAPIVIGGMLAAMMIFPALAALWIDEPPREKSDKRLTEALGDVARGVKTMLSNKVGITGVLLFLSPVGTAALTNYFSAIGLDYVRPGIPPEEATPNAIAAVQHFLLFDTKEAQDALLGIAADIRNTDLLAFLQGPVGQVLTAIGALVGGYVCDRYNRRAMYLLSGLLTAVVGIGMALSSASETTLIWGILSYSLVTGFCYAAFTATVLETIGKGGAGASTKYSLFVAAGNTAIAYVGLIDSRFEGNVSHIVASDATLNIAGVVILALVFWRLGLFRKRSIAEDAEPDPQKS